MKTKLITTAILALSLTACGNVTKENYDKIGAGMEYNEVIDVLGDPDNCEKDMLKINNCIWGDETKHIKIAFAFEKATIHSQKGL